MEEDKLFLGRGWAFPPTFNKGAGAVVLVEGVEDINQSLEILLSTSLGERILQPEYGCNLSEFQFEPINANFVAFVEDLVRTAILYYEPRIEVEQISVSESTGNDAIEGRLLISVDYLIRSTNSRFNFVFPFYINEAFQDLISIAQQR